MDESAGNSLSSPVNTQAVVRRGPVSRFFRSAGRFVFEVAKVVFIALIIIVPVRIFIFQPFQVNGNSMLPNYEDRDYLIIDEISYRFREPERGDVVVFRYPRDRSQFFIKRVIGLPGETISIEEGQVYISIVSDNPDQEREKLDESLYLPEEEGGTEGALEVVLADDEFFVLGDNRDASSDSRSWGPLMRDDIIGRAWVRAWPFDRAEVIDEPIYEFMNEPANTNP